MRYRHPIPILDDMLDELHGSCVFSKIDLYIYWHRLKDEDVVHDIFWRHPNAVKLSNAYNLAFLIDFGISQR